MRSICIDYKSLFSYSPLIPFILSTFDLFIFLYSAIYTMLDFSEYVMLYLFHTQFFSSL